MVPVHNFIEQKYHSAAGRELLGSSVRRKHVTDRDWIDFATYCQHSCCSSTVLKTTVPANLWDQSDISTMHPMNESARLYGIA